MKPDIKPRTLLIAAGGTGGHIFPGLAVAKEMHKRGWRVLWLGHPERMEGAIVPGQGFELLPLRFAGLRGKGCKAWLKLPFTLLAACLQAHAAIKQCQPAVVLGMGGYVAFPAGLMAKLSGTPLVIHEQNAVAGSTNRWLAKLAHTTLAGFPGALPGAQVAGNPVDERMFMMPDVATRYAASIDAPLRIVVMGGSQGAQVLNDIVPQALAMVREALNHPPAPPAAHADKGVRPVVRIHHQTGRGSDDDGRMEAVRAAYRGMPDVQHCCEAFFDTVCELAQADVLIARAGAMTVSEVAAAGVATLFVPLPHAIDDHQRANARFLSDCGSAWLQEQKDFTAQWLAQWLMQRTRSELMQTAQRARQHARPQAAQHIADACERAADKTAPPLPSGGIGAAATKDTA